MSRNQKIWTAGLGWKAQTKIQQPPPIWPCKEGLKEWDSNNWGWSCNMKCLILVFVEEQHWKQGLTKACNLENPWHQLDIPWRSRPSSPNLQDFSCDCFDSLSIDWMLRQVPSISRLLNLVLLSKAHSWLSAMAWLNLVHCYTDRHISFKDIQSRL